MLMNYRSKYGNKKVVRNGITFDSVKEANRYAELLLLERAGAISNLQRQVTFQLIPAQYEEITDIKGKAKRRCIERACSYIADFVYTENGKTVVEDTKGFRTADYIIKRKLMLKEHGIKVKEL